MGEKDNNIYKKLEEIKKKKINTEKIYEGLRKTKKGFISKAIKTTYNNLKHNEEVAKHRAEIKKLNNNIKNIEKKIVKKEISNEISNLTKGINTIGLEQINAEKKIAKIKSKFMLYPSSENKYEIKSLNDHIKSLNFRKKKSLKNRIKLENKIAKM